LVDVSRVTCRVKNALKPAARVLGAALIAMTAMAVVPTAVPEAVAQDRAIDPSTMVSEQALRSWQVFDLQPAAQSTMPDWDVLVWDFAELNGVMYVAGRFRKVREFSGAPEHNQAYLAAFDVATGQWISTFRPNIDDGVYSVAASPDGSRILIGGEFTSVNGAPLTAAFAALDPFTGAPDPNWKASVTRDNGEVIVKDIVVSDDHVYIGGRFSHVQTSPGAAPTRRYSLARLDGATGALDASWTVPVNGGKIMSMALSPDTEELYLGGFFTTVGVLPGTKWMAMIETGDGTVVPLADPIPEEGKWYVFSVDVGDNKVFAGTERHHLMIWDRDTLTMTHDYFTGGYGGDYQAVLLAPSASRAGDGPLIPNAPALDAAADRPPLARNVGADDQPADVPANVLWAGGHHHGWEQNNLGDDRSRTQAQWLTAFDGDTGARIDGWTARLGMRDGVFALAQDSEGKLWVGGDPSSAGTVPTSGFAVLPLRSDDDEVNLARAKSVSQSSTGDSGIIWEGKSPEERCDNGRNDLVGPAGAAVDGKTAGGAWECSFSATDPETDPWWQVDLGEVGEVDMIRIWNMFSSGAPEDLSDVWIAVSEDADAIDSTDPVALAADPEVTITQIPGRVRWYHEVPIGANARYVRLFMNSATPVQLRLPEVEVLDLPDVSPPPPVDTSRILVAPGSVWKYLDDGSNPGQGWTARVFDDGQWAEGPALIGFGDNDIVTETATGVITTYLRHEFDVANPAAIAGLSLELLADDGAVAYLNGTELHRLRMPAGPIAQSTKAAGTVWGAAERAWTSVAVPSDALVAGSNVLAVELHNNWRGGNDLAGDAALTVIDDVIAPPPVDQVLVDLDGTWSYLDTGVTPPADWATAGFDDGSWSTGQAQFGYGDGDEATVVEQGPVPNRHITTWFRTSFSVADPADIDHLDLALIRDDGAIVYLNGTELVRTNMPAGPVTAATRATDYAWGPGETEPQLYSVPADALVAGRNTIAVEIHSASPGSRDLSFALEVTGVAP
jgi:hypothetical protein